MKYLGFCSSLCLFISVFFACTKKNTDSTISNPTANRVEEPKIDAGIEAEVVPPINNIAANLGEVPENSEVKVNDNESTNKAAEVVNKPNITSAEIKASNPEFTEINNGTYAVMDKYVEPETNSPSDNLSSMNYIIFYKNNSLFI